MKWGRERGGVQFIEGGRLRERGRGGIRGWIKVGFRQQGRRGRFNLRRRGRERAGGRERERERGW